MPENFGRLALTLPGGRKQEYGLAKANVTAGRASVSDIVLRDPKASRNHARIECDASGCTVVDLGSANGTRVNGQAVKRALLASGDVIALGDSTLRFEVEAGEFESETEMTRMETEADFERTMVETPVVVQLEETSLPRVAIHMPGKTWEVPLNKERLSIGRHSDNDIAIESPVISRRHAALERSGDGFFIRDLNSDNGTWVAGRRITTHTLSDGDTVRIGNALIVFKPGFAPDDLTVVEAPKQRPRRPVVVVPGMGGTNLWRGSEQVWPTFRTLTEMNTLRVPDGEPVEARGLVDRVVIVPNLIKLEQYSILVDYLVEGIGYERGKDLLEFGYDFRQDVRRAARQLGAAIEAWGAAPPVTILAHSLGCLVSQYYVECLGGQRMVERVVYMGAPHMGVPKAFWSLHFGPQLFPFGLMDLRVREVIATFPSAYQILPTYDCITDAKGQPLSVLNDDRWLPAPRRHLLKYGRELRSELGARPSISSLCVFGYGLKTMTRISVERDSDGACQNLSPVIEPEGDSTIPSQCSILEGADIHPIRQYHGTMFVDNDVKMRLKLELTRQPRQ